MLIATFSDPGHSWYAVARSTIARLGLLDKISMYSYQCNTGDVVYLEEDCDAGLVLSALKDSGVDFEIQDFISENKDSFVRSCNRFSV